MSGDAILYVESQQREEDERQGSRRRGQFTFRGAESRNAFLRAEAKFYSNVPSTPAMEAAVKAFQNAVNRDKYGPIMDATIIPFSRERVKKMSQLAQAASVISQTQAPQQAYFPTESDWKMMLSWGTSALKSGFLPSSIKSPEAAAIIALKGRELGIPFMVAVSHIHIISGKPTLSAELMQALAKRNLTGLVINIIESTEQQAIVEFIRPEKDAKAFRSTFTMDNAKTADLLKNDVWRKYPTAMLWSRAISAGLRKVCPEALMGISYTPEELGEEVNEQGEVIETTGRKIEGTPDPAESKEPKGTQASPESPPVIRPSQREIKYLFTLNKKAGNTEAYLRDILKGNYGIESTKELTMEQYHELRQNLEILAVADNEPDANEDWTGLGGVENAQQTR